MKYSYSNAEQDDLWAELTAASLRSGSLTRNITVKEVMDTWTTQTGYPILTVTRDYSDKSLTISQVIAIYFDQYHITLSGLGCFLLEVFQHIISTFTTNSCVRPRY